MEVCSCGARTKVHTRNKVKGSECIECGRIVWNNQKDLDGALFGGYKRELDTVKSCLGEPLINGELF